LNKQNDDKHAYVIAKTENSIQLEIRDIVDLQIDEATLSKALGEYYDKIISIINRDNEGREETKFEEIIAKISPEELKLNLDNLQNKIDKVRILKKILEKTERDDTKQFADKELQPIAKELVEDYNGIGNDLLYYTSILFFSYKLDKVYPDLGIQLAEKWLREDAKKFFSCKLHEKYPKLGRSRARQFAKDGDSNFFFYHLDKTYPEFKELIAEKWATNPHRLFFFYHLDKTYPELGRQVAERWAKDGDSNFFFYHLDKKYPDLEAIYEQNKKASRRNQILKFANDQEELPEDSIIRKHYGVDEPKNQEEEYSGQYQVTTIRKLQPPFKLQNIQIQNSTEVIGNTEPVGGLWTSTLEKGSSAWIDFVKNEIGGGVSRGAIFSTKGAKVYHINSKEDYESLKKRFKREPKTYTEKLIMPRNGLLDWEAISKVYDAVHVSDAEKICLMRSNDYVDELASWDIESTLWLNSDHIKVEEISPIREWKLKTVAKLNDGRLRSRSRFSDIEKYAYEDVLSDEPPGTLLMELGGKIAETSPYTWSGPFNFSILSGHKNGLFWGGSVYIDMPDGSKFNVHSGSWNNKFAKPTIRDLLENGKVTHVYMPDGEDYSTKGHLYASKKGLWIKTDEKHSYNLYGTWENAEIVPPSPVSEEELRAKGFVEIKTEPWKKLPEVPKEYAPEPPKRQKSGLPFWAKDNLFFMKLQPKEDGVEVLYFGRDPQIEDYEGIVHKVETYEKDNRVLYAVKIIGLGYNPEEKIPVTNPGYIFGFKEQSEFPVELKKPEGMPEEIPEGKLLSFPSSFESSPQEGSEENELLDNLKSRLKKIDPSFTIGLDKLSYKEVKEMLDSALRCINGTASREEQFIFNLRRKNYQEMVDNGIIKEESVDHTERLTGLKNKLISRGFSKYARKVQNLIDQSSTRKDLIYKLAGIRENLIKKYPDLKEYILEVENKIDKKYLTWFAKQLVNFENKEAGSTQLYDYIIEFKNHQQLLESKDLYQYNFQSLQKTISAIKLQKHEARQVAKQYYQLLKQKREEYRNLNMDRKEVRAKSYEDGRRFLDNIKPKSFQSFVRQEISKVIEERERLRGLEKTARENSDVIFEDENYLVVLPGTEQASKYFGSGTQWCTAAEKDNMFVTYSSNNVYLYYILNKENDDKHAYVIAKYDNSIQLEIRDIADVEISKADLSKALGEYYDKIIPAINRDNEGREETKFEEILTKIGPEDLKLNLDAVDADHSKVELLNNVDNKTEREDTKKFIAAELFSIAKRIIGSESDNLYIIFDYNLNNRFPDLEYSAAQIASKRGYTEFFDYSLYEKYPELEMAAAKKLAENDNFSFTTRKLHRRYPDLGKMVAEKMADSVDDYFFSCNFHEMYPDLERKLAESAADLGRDKVFFKYSLEKKYPDLERKLAEKLINGRASSFFYHGLDRTYPDLIGKEHAERVARYSSRIFFEYGLYKKYPELERLSVEALVEDEDFKTFLDFSFLGRKYPELERKMAETFVSRDDAHFFYANFDKKYPGLERQLAEQWAQKSNSDFINFDLGRKYPDLKKVYMKVAIDINDRLIRLGNKLEDSGFKTYAKKVDNLIDCPFDNCNIAY
jgi:hypothetical protein